MPVYPPQSSSMSSVSAGLDAQVNFFAELTRKSVESALKLSQLNMQFAQQVLQQSAKASRDMLACSNPMQMASIAASASAPLGEQLRNYQQQVMGVLSSVQTELTRSAEAVIPPALRGAGSMAETITRSAEQASDAMNTRSYGGNGSGTRPH